MQNTRPDPIDKNIVRHRFDASAATYDKVAVLQREVADRLIERLQYIKIDAAIILDVGSGTGYGAQQLAKTYPKANIVQLDIAPGMLRLARSKTPLLQRWRKKPGFICGDMERLPFADQSVDFVFSSLAMQWCGNLDHVFREFQRVLKPGGLLMFTSLGPDTFYELRRSWAAVDGYSHVSTFIDMHDLGDAMMRSRFMDPVLDVEKLTLTYGDLSAFMRDLRALGSRNAAALDRAPGLTGKGSWQKLTQAYEQFRRDGRLPVTYEVVYGHAWGRGLPVAESKAVKAFPIPVHSAR